MEHPGKAHRTTLERTLYIALQSSSDEYITLFLKAMLFTLDFYRVNTADQQDSHTHTHSHTDTLPCCTHPRLSLSPPELAFLLSHFFAYNMKEEKMLMGKIKVKDSQWCPVWAMRHLLTRFRHLQDLVRHADFNKSWQIHKSISSKLELVFIIFSSCSQL